jgi:hypothetical protein
MCATRRWALLCLVMSPGDANASALATRQSTRLAEVEARLVDYHEVSFAEALEGIAYLRDEGDSVIAGGSLTLGLGNKLSDLDIIVSGASSAESSPVPLEHWVKTLRIDVWKRRDDALDELLHRAERALASDAPVEGAFGDIFEESDLKLLHRVAFGITIDGPALEPRSDRPYHQVAADLLVREYAERMREAAFVAQLASAANDPIGAASNARLAVQSALHATVYAHGLPFTGDKWLRERLEVDAPRLLDVHESYAVLPNDPQRAPKFVQAAVARCERLAGRELSLSALTAEVWVDTGDLVLLPAGERRFLVSPARDGLWEIDENTAQAWASVAGQQSWTCESGQRGMLELSYGLYAAGVAQLRWRRGVPLGEVDFAAEAIA